MSCRKKKKKSGDSELTYLTNLSCFLQSLEVTQTINYLQQFLDIDLQKSIQSKFLEIPLLFSLYIELWRAKALFNTKFKNNAQLKKNDTKLRNNTKLKKNNTKLKKNNTKLRK